MLKQIQYAVAILVWQGLDDSIQHHVVMTMLIPHIAILHTRPCQVPQADPWLLQELHLKSCQLNRSRP